MHEIGASSFVFILGNDKRPVRRSPVLVGGDLPDAPRCNSSSTANAVPLLPQEKAFFVHYSLFIFHYSFAAEAACVCGPMRLWRARPEARVVAQTKEAPDWVCTRVFAVGEDTVSRKGLKRNPPKTI